MFVGTAGAQVVILGSAPLLSRLYSPSEYGVLAVFVSALGIVSLLGSFNYELGIPIASSDRQARSALVVAVALLALSALLLMGIAAVVVRFGWLPASYQSRPAFLLVIPIGLLMIGLYGILTQWCFRVGDFGAVGRTKFTQSLAQVGTSVALGLAGAGPIGLVLGKVFGQGGGWIFLALRTLRLEVRKFKVLTRHDLATTAKRFRNFAFFTTPRRYLGEVAIALPGLFLASSYGSAAAGFYMLASSTLQMPLNLLGSSVGSVYFAEAARLRRSAPSRIKELSSRLFWTLLGIVVPVLVGLALFSGQMFGLVFGAEWSPSGQYAIVLSIGIGCRFVLKPLSNIFDIFERQGLSLVLNMLRILLILAGFGISLLFGWSAVTAVATFSIATGLVYVVQYVVARRIMSAAIQRE